MAETARRARAKPKAAGTKASPPKPKPKPKPKPAKGAAAKAKAEKPSAAPAPVVTPAEGPWSLRLQPYALQGCAFGSPYPSVVFNCAIPVTSSDERAALTRRFEALLEGVKDPHPLAPFVDPAAGDEADDTAQWFAALADRLQQLANLPVYVPARVVGRGPEAMSILVPVLSRGAQPTIDLLKLFCAAFARDGDGVADLAAPAHTAFAALKGSALLTSNTPRLVKAAVDNDIAFQELAGSMMIYGIGCNSVLMDSTFTHECSNIGARLAKYKQLSTAFLRRAGLPAPANGLAHTEEQAIQLARQLGYPVVVKPADKDGGIAVQADLRTDDEVKWAYEGARKASSAVLVEKFVEGLDYRIVVFRGRAIWAKERRPAGVTGDGTATIFELVERINADPRRGSDVYAALKKIVLDDDAERLLARDGLSPDSVPAEGEFVRLRRRANVSSGGVPVAVTDRMHPDNARLAERAAELIGLDLAGVDLIMPDIGKSWREVPSAICEINAQPELGGDAEHLYPEVLTQLVNGDGHIPTIAVLGGPEAEKIARALGDALGKHGVCVGIHDRSGVRVGNETVVAEDIPLLRAGRMLTMDRRVEAIVLGAIDPGILRHGLPVQRIDALLLTGETPAEADFAKGTGVRLVPEMLSMIAPHCRSVVSLVPAADFDPALRSAVARRLKLNRIVATGERATFLGNLVKATLAARAGQGRARG